MSFLESVFSFLFGDGNPNSDLEERRFKAIAQVIYTRTSKFMTGIRSWCLVQSLGDRRSSWLTLRFLSQLIRDNDGVVTAEQLAPYMNPDREYKKSDRMPDESFLLPAVTQFQVCVPYTHGNRSLLQLIKAHVALERIWQGTWLWQSKEMW